MTWTIEYAAADAEFTAPVGTLHQIGHIMIVWCFEYSDGVSHGIALDDHKITFNLLYPFHLLKLTL